MLSIRSIYTIWYGDQTDDEYEGWRFKYWTYFWDVFLLHLFIKPFIEKDFAVTPDMCKLKTTKAVPDSFKTVWIIVYEKLTYLQILRFIELRTQKF